MEMLRDVAPNNNLLFIDISVESGNDDLTNVGHFIAPLQKNRQSVPISGI